jgi:hypothetical protein
MILNSQMAITTSSDTSSSRDYALFLLFIVGTNPATTWGTSDFILVFLSFIGLAYILFIMRERLDPILLYVFIFWTVINFLSWIFVGNSGLKLSTFIGSYLKLFIGYAFIKIAKERFISWFEKTAYALALVSIPFFILQLVRPELFGSIPFNFVEAGRRAEGHWNGVIFNYSTFHSLQNSGFGAESGTFGYYIGMAMIFNLILNRGEFNKRFLILLLVGLTTFSTTFYLTLALFALFFMRRLSIFIRVISVVVAIPLIYLIYQLPFIGEKISVYFSETSAFSQSTIVQSERVNRLSTFFKDMDLTLRFPIGYGANLTGLLKNIYGQVITGTNGISYIAVRFGLFGLIYFCVIYFKLFKKLCFSRSGSYLFVIILFFYIASNPMERDYFALSLFWLYFVGRFSQDIGTISSSIKA